MNFEQNQPKQEADNHNFDQKPNAEVQAAANKVLQESLGSVQDTYRGLHKWFEEEIGATIDFTKFQNPSAANQSNVEQVAPENKQDTQPSVNEAASKVLNESLGTVEETYRGLQKFFDQNLKPSLIPIIGSDYERQK